MTRDTWAWLMKGIVLLAATLHLLWGALLLVSANALTATPVHGLERVAGNRFLLGAVLLGVAVLAIWGALARESPRPWHLLAALPQQFVLLVSATAATTASLLGAYADGTPKPGIHIFSDQLPMVLLALFHTVVLLAAGIYGSRR